MTKPAIYEFNVKETTTRLTTWLQEYFASTPSGKAIIGISGGADSSVLATFIADAIGVENMICVTMPNGEQSDIGASYKLMDHLQVPRDNRVNFNISDTLTAFYETMDKAGIIASDATIINTPARIRMTTLYALAPIYNARVANTCNLSEDVVGYATFGGDNLGAFAPLSDLTKTEIRALGKYMGIPDDLVYKTPQDGLCGKSDEENFGFSYDVLDAYIRTGNCEDGATKNKIDRMYRANKFKTDIIRIPKFESGYRDFVSDPA